MAENNLVQYPLRMPTDVMEGLRRIAKRDGRSLNAVMVSALRTYVGIRQQRRRHGRMRWVLDGTEYNTETATELAHGGRDRHTDERIDVLYRTPEGEYFMVDEDEDEGASILQVLRQGEAYDVYLGLAYHLVDEDEAFDFADEEEDAKAPVT